MGRQKKSAPAAAMNEPEFESQDVADEETTAIEPAPEDDDSEAAVDGPNKSEAARKAINAGHAKPGKAVAWIRETFGIDMNPQHFSSIKSTYMKKQAGSAPTPEPAGRRQKPKSPATTPATRPVPKAIVNGEADLIESLETLKPLIASMGAEKVKRLVDLLG